MYQNGRQDKLQPQPQKQNLDQLQVERGYYSETRKEEVECQ